MAISDRGVVDSGRTRAAERGNAMAWIVAGCLLAMSSCAPPAGAPTLGPGLQPEAAVVAIPDEPIPISREEFAARRTALVREIGDGVLVVFGVPEEGYRPYVQNSNFRYLTGVLEPGAALLITKSGARIEQTLFVLPRDPAREVWYGPRLGTDGALALTGIPSRTADRFLPALDSAVARHQTVYTLIPDPAGEETLSREQQILQRVLARHPGRRVVRIDEPIRRLRGTKSAAELDMIRRAVHVSGIAHREAMRAARSGMNEFEIQALVEYLFRRNGAERPAYASIVGSGPNSTTLHYRDADRYMRSGEVLLLDVGASYRGYAADVTRTMPVDGVFSPEQRAIYEVVLAAQKAAENAVRPNAAWADAGSAANEVISDGLARLGLIDAADATYDCLAADQQVSTCPQYRIFYMHGLGHGVGLDVHDPDVFLNFGSFRVGSAFTIEPGIYVRADAFDHLPDTPGNRAMIQRLRPALERHRNIGVRIEDVYLITADGGVERISADAPREIAEIEALMREESFTAPTRRGEVVEWYRASEPHVPR
jgi:Xaa-Pro aminopeptidase